MDAMLTSAEFRQQADTAAAPQSGHNVAPLQRAIVDALVYDVGKDPVTARGRDRLMALSRVTRDRQVDRWMQTTRRQYQQNSKRVYYMSMVFLCWRTLTNILLATALAD